MEKNTEIWTVSELRQHFMEINFPEYQREPNIWSHDAKQRLVDSMLRNFDISSFYLYMNDDESIDCVDGRQRIGAIMSFLGENPSDPDNGFEFRILNEIYKDDKPLYLSLENKRFGALKKLHKKNELARKLVESFESYKLTIVQLSGSREAHEFNLQFARLNLGTIINSGEKLHAMVGALRDTCFKRIGSHAFLKSTSVPTRRFSREQTAAQILAQAFSLETTGEFTRARHFDIQRLFKDHTTLTAAQEEWIQKTERLMALLDTAFEIAGSLRSRALVVSTVLFAYEKSIKTKKQASELAEFINAFVCRLRWQVKKGVDMDNEYRYLLDFQRHLTQGSAEKKAVEGRADILKDEFSYWEKSRSIRGDEAYRKRHPGKNPQ